MQPNQESVCNLREEKDVQVVCDTLTEKMRRLNDAHEIFDHMTDFHSNIKKWYAQKILLTFSGTVNDFNYFGK